jgi:F0F1-type ATP synthase membrane subunit b/b'
MINTAEFWVAVAFFICVGLSFKLIIPSLKAQLNQYQYSIEQMFTEADNTLAAAQKKYMTAKEHINSLSELARKMEKDLEAEVNYALNEWNREQDKISQKYRQIQENKLYSLKNHSENELYHHVIQKCMQSLEVYFKQHLDSKINKQIIVQVTEKLPKF